MPEQEKKPQAAAEQSLPGPEALGASMQAEAGGVEAISPLLIIPPVVIAAVMSLLLALVYGVTKEPIAEAQRQELNKKLAVVMPEFDNDPGTTVQDLSETVKMYTGMKDGEVSGFALTSIAPKSYSGGFSVIFGITPDGKINKVRVLSTAETPGLGSKADAIVVGQLDGRELPTGGFKVKKDGGDIDAISGATITSRAVCDGVNLGLKAFDDAGGAEGAIPADPVETIEQLKAEMEPAGEPAAEATETPVDPDAAAAPAETGEETGTEPEPEPGTAEADPEEGADGQ